MYHHIYEAAQICFADKEDMMAFTDSSGRVDPKSLGVTIAINGGLVLGLMLLGSTIAKEVPNIIELIRPTETLPIVEPNQEPIKAKKALPTKAAIVPPTKSKSAIKGDNLGEAALGPLGIPTPPLGPEIESLPPTMPLLPPVPVLISAKRDAHFAADFQPAYPPGMIREEVEGSVTVRVLIGTDGRVKAVETVASDHQAFFEATRTQAFKRWRFKPATKDGVAVESWQQLTVRFLIPK